MADLREQVCAAYSAAAEEPEQRHPFPVGRRFAESVGYSPEFLDEWPGPASRFCGTSCVAVFAEIPAGARVLDLGCGGGLDSLLAARRTGPGGGVTAVDFSESMLAVARAAAEEAGLDNVEFRSGDAERIPAEDGSVDVALVNGIFNLNPRREEIFRELARVLKPGGAVFGAEIILRKAPRPLRGVVRTLAGKGSSADNWFA